MKTKALARFKGEKTRAWRGEEQRVAGVLAASGRRLAAVLPLLARSSPSSSDTLLCAAWALLQSLQAVAPLVQQIQASQSSSSSSHLAQGRDGLMAALVTSGESLVNAGVVPGQVVFSDWLRGAGTQIVARAHESEQSARSRIFAQRVRERDERRQEAARKAMETAELESRASSGLATEADLRWANLRRSEGERRRELLLATRQVGGGSFFV